MTYESQGIFAEGRGIAIAKEAGSGQNQSCKGKRGESRKKKRQSVCECCGITYEPTRKAKGKFCGYDCFYRDKQSHINSLAPCLSCHALLGMTGAASGRMLNLSKFQICKYRKRMKLRTLKPSEANIKATIQARINKEANAPWWGDHAAAWMSEYKPKFFDWSYEWNRELWKRKHRKLNPNPRIPYTKEQRRQKLREYTAKRMVIDPGFRVQSNLRNRLKKLMKVAKHNKGSTTSSLIGCSSKQLAKHLEAQFKRGMTWDNYGERWHVDHILPCATFDHTDQKQVAQCWHWTNLRPLDAQKNMDKGDSITEPQMSLLLCATH